MLHCLEWFWVRHHQNSYCEPTWSDGLHKLAVNWLDSELKPILFVFQQKQVDMDHRLTGQLINSWNNDQRRCTDYSNVAITAFGQPIQQIFNNLSTINILAIYNVYVCKLCNRINNNIISWFITRWEIIYFQWVDFGNFPIFEGCPQKTIIINN